MVATIDIPSRRIGPGQPCLIIAEAGVNHNGSLEMAKRLVAAAREAGADAVKFQTWVTEKLMVPDAPLAEYQARNVEQARSQFEMAKQLELSYDQFRKLKAYAERVGILFFSTPDEEDSADFLEQLGVPLFKIGSGEVTNLPFLQHIASKGRPLILSTGMSTLKEVETAVRAIEATGNRQLALLHCVSSYPAAPADCNLHAMDTLALAFGYPVGFSDHTLTFDVPIAAVARGACVIEKHFTLDKTMAGPDHRASLEPPELRALVTAIRQVESALGDGIKRPMPGELDTRRVARRSLVARKNVQAGAILSMEDLAIRRPGTGIAPAELKKVVGRRLVQSIQRDQLLSWEDLE